MLRLGSSQPCCCSLAVGIGPMRRGMDEADGFHGLYVARNLCILYVPPCLQDSFLIIFALFH